MLLKALRPWLNYDYEGYVEAGQTFDASEYRARELIRIGLAVAVAGTSGKIHVPADPPQHHHRKPRAAKASVS